MIRRTTHCRRRPKSVRSEPAGRSTMSMTSTVKSGSPRGARALEEVGEPLQDAVAVLEGTGVDAQQDERELAHDAEAVSLGNQPRPGQARLQVERPDAPEAVVAGFEAVIRDDQERVFGPEGAGDLSDRPVDARSSSPESALA